MNMLKWFKKADPKPPVPETPDINKIVADAVSAAIAEHDRKRTEEEKKRERRDRVEQEREARARAQAELERAPLEEVPPDDTKPSLTVEIKIQINQRGGLEVVYNFDHNSAAIVEIDKTYEGVASWSKARRNEDKVVLFLYDAISTLAEPLLPDATVDELDWRRDMMIPTVERPFVTDEFDVANMKRIV